MKENILLQNKVKQGVLYIVIGLLITFPLYRGIANNGTWSEDFEETPDDWSLSYWDTSTGVFVKQPESGFIIENGILIAPNDRTFDFGALAYHNSSVAYGTWAFDWVIKPGTEHSAYDIIYLLGNDSAGDYDPSGETWDEYLNNDYAYILGMSSSTATGGAGTWVKPGINFFKRAGEGDNDIMLNQYKFTNDISGTHRVEVTRDISGKFRIYFDDTFLFSATDNEFKSSEKFLLASTKGDSGFDNITITDNTTLVDTRAPNIGEATYSPLYPDIGKNISIEVKVIDDFELASVEIFYRVDTGSWISKDMTQQLNDYYNISIGPFYGSKLEFYIKAIDTSAYETTSQIKTVTLNDVSTTTTTTTESTPSFKWVYFLVVLSLLSTKLVISRKRKH